MASKKDLKKDINYLVDEVIGTCLMQHQMQGGKNHEAMETMVNDMLTFREEIIEKTNHPDPGPETKNLKAYYRDLHKQLLEKANEAFETIHKAQ